MVEKLSPSVAGPARYVVKVFMNKSRSLFKPSLFLAEVLDRGPYPSFETPQYQMPWCGISRVLNENGSVFIEGSPGCGKIIPIPYSPNEPETVTCPNCNRIFSRKEMIFTYIGRLSIGELASFLASAIQPILPDVDIELHYDPVSRRELIEENRPMDDDLRAKRTMSVYTHKRLTEDLLAGADLTKRLKAFLSA